ncbi:MAG: ATP-binding cassette domain-containing protein [Ilumatobacteraceae bacterium]
MQPILEVKDLLIRYRAGLFAPRPKPAVNGASFRLDRGATLGIVGESGSGKTSLLRAILRLLPVEGGSIRLDGQDWLCPAGPDVAAGAAAASAWCRRIRSCRSARG